jgi:hypothetical protein
MQILLSNNSNIETITHVPNGKNRMFKVKFLEHTIDSFEFSYREKEFKEFIFRSGFAISGGINCGHYGIVSENKFYCDEFSKQPKKSKFDSVFWGKNDFGDTFDLTTKDIHVNKFKTEVNLWFNISEYWHWFCEDLPIIKYLRTNNHPIITNKLQTWQKQSLEFFPDIKQRIIEVETPTIINATAYHTFTYPAVSRRGKTNNWVSEFLKENLIPSSQDKATDLIYISRGDAVARVVENEDDIKNLLTKKGFKCYDNFSNYSVQEKINIFSKAKIVVAPTGSNLTHCHAMQSGTKVLDFNHEFELTEECGWNSIGTGVGVLWHTLPAQTGATGPRSGKGLKQKNNNLIVDIQKLENALKYVLD